MTRDELLRWLYEDNARTLEELWAKADAARAEHVGDAVHLRGLIEVSNYCVRRCAYCGIRGPNTGLTRYRMSPDEILACAREAAEFGYGTVVLQSGEDYGMGRGWMGNVIRRIKAETGLAVTLSLGERPHDDLAAWREAGADRYLLRFETSDETLYQRIHPDLPGKRGPRRIEQLRTLQRLGYETGSGVMVGIPGQSYESLADDICLFAELDLDMVGIGPYLPHPDTPLAAAARRNRTFSLRQTPNTALMACKTVALTRLTCPDINIPSTTALAAVDPEAGRASGLRRGANVVMPNLTPPDYRQLYEIYPAKGTVEASSYEFHEALLLALERMGRRAGTGPGGRRRTAGRTTGS